MDNLGHFQQQPGGSSSNDISQGINVFTTPLSKPEEDPFDISPISIMPSFEVTDPGYSFSLPPNAGLLDTTTTTTLHTTSIPGSSCVIPGCETGRNTAATGPPPTKKKKPASTKEVLIKTALDHVICTEKHHLRSLERANGNEANGHMLTPAARLMDLMAMGTTERAHRSAVNKIECSLGKWVVHSYKHTARVYIPGEHQQRVLELWNNGNRQQELHRIWLDDIEQHAKKEKLKYKHILDARKDALDGILGNERARLVNNQKSAHLSKFQNNIVEASKDSLIKFLVDSHVGLA